MPDLDQLLHDTAPRPSEPVDTGALHDRIRARRRRRHVGTGLLSVALIALVGLGASSLFDAPTPRPFIEQDATEALGLSAGWTKAVAGPLAGRDNAAVIPLDDHRILVIGGFTTDGDDEDAASDGAIYDVRSGEWELIPPAPFAIPLGAGVALDDGDVVVLGPAPAGVGIQDGRIPVASFSIVDGTWTSLPDVPSTQIELFSTDAGVVALGIFDVPDPAPLLRLSTDRTQWTALPVSPLPAEDIDIARYTTDDETQALVHVGRATPDAPLQVARFENGAWQTGPVGPTIGEDLGRYAVHVSQGVLVMVPHHGAEPTPTDHLTLLHDLTAGVWTTLPASDRDGDCCWAPIGGAGGIVTRRLDVLNPTTGRMAMTQPPSSVATDARLAWLGDTLITFGGRTRDDSGATVGRSAELHLWRAAATEPKPEVSPTAEPAPVATTEEQVPTAPSQSVEDSARDGVDPAIAALSFEQRLDPTHAVSTAEGVWIASVLPPGVAADIDATTAFGETWSEIVLLDPDSKEIIRAWPLVGFPSLQLTATPDGIWAWNGGTTQSVEDQIVARIDRGSLELQGRILASPSGRFVDATPGDEGVPPNTVIRPNRADLVASDTRPLNVGDMPATQGDVAWFGSAGFDEALEMILPRVGDDVISDGRTTYTVTTDLVSGTRVETTVTPVDPRTLELLADPLPILVGETRPDDPAVSIDPLALHLTDGRIMSLATGSWEQVADDVLATAQAPDGAVMALHGDGRFLRPVLAPYPTVEDAFTITLPAPNARSVLPGGQDITMAMTDAELLIWTPGEFGAPNRVDGVHAEEQAMLDALRDFARGPSADAFAALPLADEVSLGLGRDLIRTVPADDLLDPDAWVIDGVPYAESTGPFSALATIGSDAPRDAIGGPHPHCAGPALGTPVGLQDTRQISAQRTDADSCITWWSVDLFLDRDDERIVAITLSLFGP